MRTFRHLRIAHKLVIIMMITSSVAVLIMAVAMVLNQAIRERRAIASQLETIAQLIGSRSTGALAFDDPRTAEENLSALSVKPNIVYAAIHDVKGDIFAEYRAPRLEEDTYALWIFPDTVEVAKDIVLDGERIGRVVIVSDLAEYKATVIRHIAWTFAIVMGCLTLGIIVSARLQKVISGPIMRLRTAMDTVSKRQDYSIRAEKHSDDELGVLIDGFNEMLREIEGRDAELARYRAGLETEVMARTEELEQANRKRLSWLQMLARFLRHELRTSTAGIRTSLELIDRRTRDRSIDIYLSRARKSLELMSTLLESVANASSLEASIHRDEKTRVDLSELVRACLEEYRSSYAEQEFAATCPPGVAIRGNEARLRQMLDNLVANAIEHSRPASPIVVTLDKRDDRVELSVINEGPRLPDNKERLFDLYISLRGLKENREEHLGVGLYVVKLVAEAHGGWAQARDLEGKEGAIFTVTLPRVECEYALKG